MGRQAGQRWAAEVLAPGATGADLTLSGNSRAARQIATTAGTATDPAICIDVAGDANRMGLHRSSDSIMQIDAAGAARMTVSSLISMLFGTTFSAAIFTQADIRPAALTGDVTDYNPTGFSTCRILVIDPGAAARLVRSLGPGQDGQRILIVNPSTTAGRTLTLQHEDAAGTAAQRFYCPNLANLVMPPTSAREVIYDATLARYVVQGAVA